MLREMGVPVCRPLNTASPALPNPVARAEPGVKTPALAERPRDVAALVVDESAATSAASRGSKLPPPDPASRPPTVVPGPDPAPLTAHDRAPEHDVVAGRTPEERDRIARMDWPALRDAVATCRACGLCQSRRQTVFGTGALQAHWMIVGEAPGEQEDLQGEPFVGAAGRLLDNMLRAAGLTRADAAEEPASALPAPPASLSAQQVYIANTLKCRPPRNRNPSPEEMAQCEPFLSRQIELLRPRLILAMGRYAVQSLLRTDAPIGRLRGQVHRYRPNAGSRENPATNLSSPLPADGVPVVVTYHPAYLLRNLLDKAKAWEDLCLALRTMASLEGRS